GALVRRNRTAPAGKRCRGSSANGHTLGRRRSREVPRSNGSAGATQMNIPLEPRIPDDRRRREAAEWLVVNEAADERIEPSEAEWQSWSADARNRAEYSAMIELRQRMRA